MPPPFDHAGGLLAKLLQSVTKHKWAQIDRQRGLRGPRVGAPVQAAGDGQGGARLQEHHQTPDGPLNAAQESRLGCGLRDRST
eukprot:scaffold27474_cov29-Phaeocystis_antarctica.AAC.2